MVGNDIIDLNETRRSTNWERPRFMQKIFTPKEQFIITSSDDPFTTVWHLWSMKESAYKLFIQAGGARFYMPTKLVCTIDSLQSGRVRIDETSIKTETSVNSNYIFSTAALDSSEIETRIFQIAERNSKFQSTYMHQQVLKDFANNNSFNSTELHIQKSKTGVPTLFCKNKPLNSPLSISHHGNYGAYSILNN